MCNELSAAVKSLVRDRWKRSKLRTRRLETWWAGQMLALCLTGAALGQTAESITPASVEYPATPAHYCEDYAGVMSGTAVTELQQRLKAYDVKTTNQVVVAIFSDRDSREPLADYCTHLFNHWGVGQKGKNNGVVLFVFVKAHQMRISTGRGMEKLLPDEECKRILDKVIAPEFRKGDFDGGVSEGVEAILRDLDAGKN